MSSQKTYLKALARQFPTRHKVSEEIINLQAILSLPKSTEIFVSDIHGEFNTFSHILRNGSGSIRRRINAVFGEELTKEEKSRLATIIYYPEEKLQMLKNEIPNLQNWYKTTIYNLVKLARGASSKYTRSKVRRALPTDFLYIIDELLNVQENSSNKDLYFGQIIDSIVELGQADEFIVAISSLIKRMAVDHLHVVGDIFDRGPLAEKVMELILNFHSVDIQWGNHDILWMGAALGSKECICNVIRICSRYDNMSTLEDGYGINMRPIATFAQETYKNDDYESFLPKAHNYNKYLETDAKIMSKIQKAIAIIQFKLEGQLIKRCPHFNMENRLLLCKINFDNYTIVIDDREYQLNDKDFPTIDPKDPYALTKEEQNVIDRLQASFMESGRLALHVDFLYEKGNLYKIFNQNLLFHSCIPMNKEGDFDKIYIEGLSEHLWGKSYLDAVEKMIRRPYNNKNNGIDQFGLDFIWYFWCGEKSPLFGKSKAATFERYFIDDKTPHKEVKNPYYTHTTKKEACYKIFDEFGLCKEKSHIINGHTPVKEVMGESAIRAEGKLLVIDGGFAKSYRKQTGRAGYTLTYNSLGLVLYANEEFDSIKEVIREEKDVKDEVIVNESSTNRIRVADTDIGIDLQEQITDLKNLLLAYKNGEIKMGAK